MQDDDFGATPDVFAEVESDPDPGTADPAADPLADPADPLAEAPAGVEEAELGGDNPSEIAPDGPFMEEPEEAEPEAEPELPGEEEALAAARAAEPPPQAADPLADPEPPAAESAAEPPAPAAEPEPESEPEPAEPAAPAEPQSAEPPSAPAPKKQTKKAAKKASKKAAKKAPEAETPRKSERNYVVLYEVDGGAFAVGPTVTARTTTIALEKAFDTLSKELGVSEFKNMVPVPETAWKPEPVAGEVEQVSRVSIGK